MRLRTSALLLLSLTALGCEVIDDVRDALEEPILQQAIGLTLAGVTPAADFRDTANLEFDLLAKEDNADIVRFANLSQNGMRVEVENDDGTYSDCEYVGGENVEPLPYHALTLLIDGSGSMELEYPPSIHGDVCLTCPHDPGRERIGAARRFIETVHEASPLSPMAVAEFGPEASDGFGVTRLHSDFVNDPDALSAALTDIQGYEPVGTPLYDSVAEMIAETSAVARALEATVRHERGDDVPWQEGEELPPAQREVARHIVILSDGEDNASELYGIGDVIDFANEEGVQIYVVGLGPASASTAAEVDPEQTRAIRNLQMLARETGGFYAAAADPGQLHELYDVVGQALTQGYQTETYACLPKPTHDTPDDECDVPPVGSRMDGRITMGDMTIPWATIAD